MPNWVLNLVADNQITFLCFDTQLSLKSGNKTKPDKSRYPLQNAHRIELTNPILPTPFGMQL